MSQTSQTSDTTSTVRGLSIRKDSIFRLENYSKQQLQDVREMRARVKQHCVERFSSSPLHQARAAKDSKYWDNFSGGIVRSTDKED